MWIGAAGRSALSEMGVDPCIPRVSVDSHFECFVSPDLRILLLYSNLRNAVDFLDGSLIFWSVRLTMENENG